MGFLNGGKTSAVYSRLREADTGLVRRQNLAREEFYKQATYPKTVEYHDIDAAFVEWVKSLDTTYDGKRLPVNLMVSIQRLSEFGKTWRFEDKEGGLILNFITITRENNPKKGSIYDGSFNVPTSEDGQWYTVAHIPVISGGKENWERISMRQPLASDLIFSVSIFSTKFELLNTFNTIILDAFKGLQCYIRPNGHFMSMELQDIVDESEYDLEKRRFYSQTFKILCKAYIIKEDDFRRERLETRLLLNVENDPTRPCVYIEESEGCNELQLKIEYQKRSKPVVKFRMDEDMLVQNVVLENIKSFTVLRDGEVFDVPPNDWFNLYEFEKIAVKIVRDDMRMESVIRFVGTKPGCVDLLPKREELPQSICQVKEMLGTKASYTS